MPDLPEMTYHVAVMRVSYGTVAVKATSPGEACDIVEAQFDENSADIEWHDTELQLGDAEVYLGDEEE